MTIKGKTWRLTIAACFIATAAYAQQETPRTEVESRDNGTKKVVEVRADGSRTVTTTGKTNLGAAADNTKDAAGNVVSKGATVVKKGAKKVGRGAKKVTKKVSGGAKTATRKAEEKTE